LLLAYADRYDLLTAGTSARSSTPRDGMSMFGWDPTGAAALLGSAATGAIDLTAWDGSTRASRLELPGGVGGVAWSADGRYVATRVTTPGGQASLEILSCTTQ
jgi:hypothetical protein